MALGFGMTVYSGFDRDSAVKSLGFGWPLDRGEPRLLFIAAAAAVMLMPIATVIQVRRRAVLAART